MDAMDPLYFIVTRRQPVSCSVTKLDNEPKDFISKRIFVIIPTQLIFIFGSVMIFALIASDRAEYFTYFLLDIFGIITVLGLFMHYWLVCDPIPHSKSAWWQLVLMTGLYSVGLMGVSSVATVKEIVIAGLATLFSALVIIPLAVYVPYDISSILVYKKYQWFLIVFIIASGSYPLLHLYFIRLAYAADVYSPLVRNVDIGIQVLVLVLLAIMLYSSSLCLRKKNCIREINLSYAYGGFQVALISGDTVAIYLTLLFLMHLRGNTPRSVDLF